MASSLFDTPATPVLGASAEWANGLLSGGLATSLCVIAIAIMGLMLMTGRLIFRDAIRVMIGCFVLLGASTIAQGLGAAGGRPQLPIGEQASAQPRPAPALPPANYDPYAGASLRPE